MKIPFVCPVCQGRKTVPAGFYNGLEGISTSITPEPCQSCNAMGIVWSEDDDQSITTGYLSFRCARCGGEMERKHENRWVCKVCGYPFEVIT